MTRFSSLAVEAANHVPCRGEIVQRALAQLYRIPARAEDRPGCQVHARLDGFNEMMELARKQIDVLGIDVFTYTLMDRWA